MIILDTDNKSLEAILGAAPAVNELEIVVAYVDRGDAYQRLNEIGSNELVTNSTTAVEVVPAPAASETRQIKTLTVYNPDTIPASVTIRYNDNSTIRRIITRTVRPGETLEYEDDKGWNLIENGFTFQQLGQVRENGTAAVSVVQATALTKITSVEICNNTAVATTFSLWRDEDGVTYDDTTVIFKDAPLAANTTFGLTQLAWWLKEDGNLAYAPGTANAVTITVDGEIENV